MKIFEEIVKDGNNLLKLTWQIHENKPKCWVEKDSFEYSFNKSLVKKESYETLQIR